MQREGITQGCSACDMPLEKHNRVVILRSRHSDVSHGTKGTIAARMLGGYAVEITGPFSDAAGRVATETRCIFFATEEVAPADDAATQ